MCSDGRVYEPLTGHGHDPGRPDTGKFPVRPTGGSGNTSDSGAERGGTRYADLLQIAVRIAAGAGHRARVWRRAGFRVDTKSTPTDLVTEVDRAVETWITEQLRVLRPRDGLLAEEGADRAGEGPVRWVVDPIDGTVNFALGQPNYAISIAAEVNGQVVLGCVYNPESGELFQAELGEGAFLGARRLHGPRKISVDRAVVATGFGYDADQRSRQGSVVAALLPEVADVRRMGAASLDLCGVAAGRVDAYFEAGLNPWDYAAGLLIASEAGCAVTGLRGRAPGAEFLAVAGTSLADGFFELLMRLEADRVLIG